MLIKKREGVGLKHYNGSKAFIRYLNDLGDFYENIEERNPNKKRKILTLFDDITADMVSNERFY